jgi:threonine aldolase
MLIDLISDTVTKPSAGMIDAMMSAEVGDDVFGEDPTINKLQERLAKMFGKESGLFCPSGTMTNQLAIKILTNPLEEVLCDATSHIYQYEAGSYGFHSGVSVNPIATPKGKLTSDLIRNNIRKDHDWLAHTSLVVLENSCNKAGGIYYTNSEIKDVADSARGLGLNVHLDGARIFNALVETNDKTIEVGKNFDTLSICLSKGLGAPVGSVLIGDTNKIQMAKRFRKAFGGGMRQAGILAAAGIYALDHNITRLKDDNDMAKLIGQELAKVPFVIGMKPVMTNMVIFEVDHEIRVDQILDKLRESGVRASAFGKHEIRFVFHMDITSDMINRLVHILNNLYI